jgi:hypothetical protein
MIPCEIRTLVDVLEETLHPDSEELRVILATVPAVRCFNLPHCRLGALLCKYMSCDNHDGRCPIFAVQSAATCWTAPPTAVRPFNRVMSE